VSEAIKVSSEAIKIRDEGIVDPYSIPLADVNPLQAQLFRQDAHWDYFKRLRAEDPVHLSEDEEFGRYWHVTKFNDIKYVDKHHELFSSEGGITIGPPLNAPADRLQTRMFIAMDPPIHDVQRATVSPVVQPTNLAKMEGTIRERVIAILESLPIGETFNWVDLVSIELTTQMLATLFVFPFED